MFMARRRAFTLIEVLVSVAIIALLISIAVPSISEARLVSKRGVCQHNLHQIGLGVEQYLQVNHDVFPLICREPSVEVDVAKIEGNRRPFIPMARALARELGANSKVLECPADVVTTLSDQERMAVAGGRSRLRVGGRYYESENTSYEWDRQVNGKRRDVRKMLLLEDTVSRPLNQVPLVNDFAPFHGGPKRINGTMFLYADGHTPLRPEKGTALTTNTPGSKNVMGG
jgi:prepilin-type N-terminal cleavage/methylation domain-containing protein